MVPGEGDEFTVFASTQNPTLTQVMNDKYSGAGVGGQVKNLRLTPSTVGTFLVLEVFAS